MRSAVRRRWGCGGYTHSFWAMYSFRMSVCSVPWRSCQATPWRSATTSHIAKIMAAGLPLGLQVVGVPAHQRGHVERDGETGLAPLEEELVAAVGLGGVPVPGE